MIHAWLDDTPIGRVSVVAGDKGVTQITTGAGIIDLPGRYDPDALADVLRQLAEYFAGKRREFNIRLDLDGATEFQKAVWEATAEVPYGQTVSYGEIAFRIGRPGAARAVGGALRSNRIIIVIPCHRVIGADGSLRGYGGPSGIRIKRALLELERSYL